MQRTCPPALKPGDTVGVVCPSGPVSDDIKQAAVTALSDLGFVPRLYPEARSRKHYLAGEDHHRADMLLRAFQDVDTRAVWCLRGGYGCIRTGQYLDRELVEKCPKLFLGFSDITTLLLHFSMMIPMVTLHAPVLSQLPRLDELSREHLLDVITGAATTIPLGPSPHVLKAGRVEGELWGGNLSVLCSLVGTSWFPALEGAILFVEDVNEPAYRVDRMFEQLRLSGALGGVKALLIGDFGELDPREHQSLDHLFEELATRFDGPVIRNVPIGHGRSNVTVPIGVRAAVDTSLPFIRLLGPVTRS